MDSATEHNKALCNDIRQADAICRQRFLLVNECTLRMAGLWFDIAPFLLFILP